MRMHTVAAGCHQPVSRVKLIWAYRLAACGYALTGWRLPGADHLERARHLLGDISAGWCELPLL